MTTEGCLFQPRERLGDSKTGGATGRAVGEVINDAMNDSSYLHFNCTKYQSMQVSR